MARPRCTRLVCVLATLAVAACGGKAPPIIPVTHPAQGEALLAGTKTAIRWSDGGAAGEVDVWVTFSDGTQTALAQGAADNGELDWTVPLHTGGGTNQGLIQVLPTGTPPVLPAANATRDALLFQDTAPPGSGGAVVSMGALAAVQWNASANAEQYYWIDTVTGDSDVRGTVGDLAMLSYRASLVAGNGQVYVNGTDSSNTVHLYVLDAVSGDLVGEPQADISGVALTAVRSDGSLLGFRWNADTGYEEAVGISPDDGSITVLGTLGDLTTWTEEAALDSAADHVYAFGSPPTGSARVYTLDLSTGDLVSEPALQWQGQAGPIPDGSFVNSQGDLYGFLWDLHSQLEELVQIDPATGQCTTKASVGDLASWWGVAAHNRTDDQVYVVGVSGDNGLNLYVLDGLQGTFLTQIPVTESPTEAVFAY